ncbi:hypothetical protein BGX31_000568 [Mortierella sp. GBA43]|nr:hypothetical protein BGX31_000568 [Mortierella sp. GBA43]
MTDTAGQLIVLWEDIEDVFTGAKSVRNGDTHVPFMKDANFTQITPRRIAYHPGAVLEVDILENSNTQADMSAAAPLILNNNIDLNGHPTMLIGISSPADSTNSGEGSSSCSNYTSIESITAPSSEIALMEQDEDEVSTTIDTIQHMIRYTGRMPDEPQTSLSAYSRLHNNYLDAIMAGQQRQAASIRQLMDEHFGRIQFEIDRNNVLQEELFKMQRQMHQLQYQSNIEIRESQKLMNEKQDHSIHMQQQLLNQLALIRNRMQALLTQTYELHEYLAPRLFIVLPKDVELRGAPTNLLAEHFRLYFLCECGTHTMPEGCRTQHEIHLANHEGYDLETPIKFFERFGAYLLAMMYMIKYGVVAEGLTLPTLANFMIPEEVNDGQKHNRNLRNNIEVLVDETISYLRGLKLNAHVGDELRADQIEVDMIRALDETKLMQLEPYLKVKGQERVYGKLYRIVTQQGHVKWVCFDHFQINHRMTGVKQLRDIVQVNRGIYIEEKGQIEVEIKSRDLAKKFYHAIVKSPGIHELDIILAWKATRKHFLELYSAVTKAKVIRLSVNGNKCKSPVIDLFNHHRRFGPILQLASNARVQTLRLQGFSNFFSRVNKSALVPAPYLRELSLDYEDPSNVRYTRTFNSYLLLSSELVTLDLRCRSYHRILGDTTETLRKIRKFKLLRAKYGRFSVEITFLDGDIQFTTILVEKLGELSSDDLKFIQETQFTRIVMGSIPREADSNLLTDIISCDTPLTHLEVKETPSAVGPTTAEMELQNLVKLITPESINTFELLSLNYQRLSLTVNFSPKDRGTKLSFGWLDDLTKDDRKFIREGPYSQLTIENPHQADADRLAAVFNQSKVTSYIRVKRQKEHCLTIATIDDMKLLDLVEMATSAAPESFLVHCERCDLTAEFSQGRIQDMVMTIKRLSDLNPGDTEFIQKGHLTQLVLNSIPQKPDTGRLTDIFNDSPELNRLQIRREDPPKITDPTFDMNLQNLVDIAKGGRGKLESLSANYGRLAISGDFAQGRIQSMSMSVERLCGLRPDDLRFILQGHLSQLTIRTTPREADEGQLTNILCQSLQLSQLQIGCDGVRSPSIINLVVSARETILRDRGSSSLRTFELMEDNLAPFDMLAECDDKMHIQSHLSFPGHTDSFDMRTWIRLEKWMTIENDDPLNDFFCRYGRSIVFFEENSSTNDTFAAILDNIPSTENYGLECIRIHCNSADSATSRLDNIIERSPKLEDIGLYVDLEDGGQFKMALSVLSQHGPLISKLCLSGNARERWRRIATLFSTREMLPNLLSLELRTDSPHCVLSDSVSWIVAMISSPGREFISLNPMSLSVICGQDDRREDLGTSWVALKKIVLCQVYLQPEDWLRVIEAMDLTTLQYLDLQSSNIPLEQLRVLVNRLTHTASGMALKIIDVGASKPTESPAALEELEMMRRSVPSVEIRF